MGILKKCVHSSVMAMQCSIQWNEVSDSKQDLEPTTDLVEPPAAIASPEWEVTEFDSNVLVIRPSSVCLNLEDLKCFEVVDHQFHHYGISFINAIALQPSNPAYPPRNSATLLMAAPKSGWIEILFSQPIRQFCCYITSSQRMLLSAYDSQNNLLVRESLTQPNLADSDSLIPPNAPFNIETPNISRITFYTFDGQLTLSDLSFSF
jgi:hypothetical protein